MSGGGQGLHFSLTLGSQHFDNGFQMKRKIEKQQFLLLLKDRIILPFLFLASLAWLLGGHVYWGVGSRAVLSLAFFRVIQQFIRRDVLKFFSLLLSIRKVSMHFSIRASPHWDTFSCKEEWRIEVSLSTFYYSILEIQYPY